MKNILASLLIGLSVFSSAAKAAEDPDACWIRRGFAEYVLLMRDAGKPFPAVAQSLAIRTINNGFSVEATRKMVLDLSDLWVKDGTAAEISLAIYVSCMGDQIV